MADLEVIEDAPRELSARCRQLRHKGMYVYTDMAEGDDHAEGGTTVYSCFKTMKSFGPDDEPVDGEDCRDPGRSCYEPG